MAKKISLTQDQVAIVDDEDFHWLNKYNWHALWDSDINGYNAVRDARGINGKHQTPLMARAILGLSFGDPRQADHINRNPLDNRQENLRIVSNRENSINSNKSGIQGVSWQKVVEKWQVRICIEGKKIHLGYFHCKADAIEAYKEAEAHHGYRKGERNG